MGGRRDAGGIPPPILFLAPQKENGPWTVQEKKRIRGGAACLIPGKSLPAPWYRREFGGSRLPLLLVPLPLPRSAQGAAAKKGDRGIPDLPFPRNPRRGIRLSGLSADIPTARRSFLLDRARPVFFSARAKRKWGVHSAGKAGKPRAFEARPLSAVGSPESLRLVQQLPGAFQQRLRHPASAGDPG